MPLSITLIGLAIALLASFLFSTLTYSLRELTRARLTDALQRRGRENYLETTMDHLTDLVFVTAVFRLFSNIFILLFALHSLESLMMRPVFEYILGALLAGILSLFSSVALPHAFSRHAGAQIVASHIGFLHMLRMVLLPLTRPMQWIDRLVERITGSSAISEPQQIEQEIIAAVEEGEKEGIVDEDEREMIQSVIHFRGTTAGQIMTSRPEITGLPIDASLMQTKQVIEQSGHSRIPVFQGTLDQVKGVLYVRDLLHILGEPPERFNLRSLIRPAYFVPETRTLRDLLNDFRLQKVHIAIILDEYGGTAGMVTIEDIIEELVGDLSDEHEPLAPAMFSRIDDQTAEADARIYIDELNRIFGLTLPEDAGYDTLSGFITTTLGRIPEIGASFDSHNVKFTILEAEPQKVLRVKIELIPQPVPQETPATQNATT